MRRNLSLGVPVGAAALVLAGVFFLSLFLPAVEASTGPNLIESAGALPTDSRLVFQNPRGLHRYYAFFFYGGDWTWFYKYSSDGLSWSTDQGALDGGFGSAAVWVYDSGTQLIVHFVASGLTPPGSILYRRGTIADTSETINWTAGQTVEPGGSNAMTFGLSVTRTANGRPAITAVAEVYVNPTYRYEVRGWGANADAPTPVWTRTTLVSSFSALPTQQTGGYTSASAAGGNYIFVAASAARALISTSMPWDVSWVRASWDGALWSMGSVTTFASSESAPRPISLVEDDALLPNALAVYPSGAGVALRHYHGTAADGTKYQTFAVSSQAVTSATLSIDLSSTPKKLKAIYHYGTGNIYWKESPTSSISWGAENTIMWRDNTTDLSSAQRDFVGHVHGLAESSNGVYYFNI